MKHFQYIYILLFLVALQGYTQFKVPKKPKNQTSVYDYIGLLKVNQKQVLEDKLIQYSDSTSTQIVIGIIGSTNGESIGILTPRWAHKWGIGQKKEDNGVFILLAKDDKKIWISPGYGLEHKLTAGITGTIVRNIIVPEFKKGDYSQGLNNGIDAVFNVLNGTYKRTRQSDNTSDYDFVIFLVILIIFFIIISSGNRKNRGGNNRNYRDIDSRDMLETIILSNAGRGGWSSSGGGWSSGAGTGGFGGGFGGGGFSGGGAGGSW